MEEQFQEEAISWNAVRPLGNVAKGIAVDGPDRHSGKGATDFDALDRLEDLVEERRTPGPNSSMRIEAVQLAP